MRFVAEGPSIPDDLLNARDEGRVVFLCGAGVSRARAGLPNFFDLAEGVINKLGVQSDSSARKLLEITKEISERSGVDGLISADRVFGLLERDFLVRDIETAVAQALKPTDDVDLSAHRILLNLARTPEGKTRLITTNFDRLFEACDEDLISWKPPDLPNPTRQKELDGIVHLHGIINADYSGAEGDGFILSSSEFGHAYLAEGWATDFFRHVLKRYVVIFVGYTADDPPVHYLLEGLNKQSQTLERVYAFQTGVSHDAIAKWKHKGVEAISYDESNGHHTLWTTLGAWAERARNPKIWYQSVLNLAEQGPERLKPHERGQVAHIVSTFGGMKIFSEGNNPPPAEWLCVFDPHCRYAKPGYSGGFDRQRQASYFDPFDVYGLDTDIIPQKIEPEEHFTKREIPSGTWDGFAQNRFDRQNLSENHFPAFRGVNAANMPSLPARLIQFGVWFEKIAHQPASVWWAAKQSGLHPDIQFRILLKLGLPDSNFSPKIRQAWHYLLESWKTKPDEYGEKWHNLKGLIRKEGWNSTTVRNFCAINRPYLKIENNSLRLKPPESTEDIKLIDMIKLDVEYSNQGYEAEIPPEWISLTVREFRKNLELALLLETERGGYALTRISPIIPDPDPSIDSYNRSNGLSGALIYFSSLYEKLLELNLKAAQQEFSSWPVDDETIFTRLRIWACGKKQLVSEQDFAKHIGDLSDAVFWKSSHQRDLLLVLAKRWSSLEEPVQKTIEGRLLGGPPKWDREENNKYMKRKAWASLERISWMNLQGCKFNFDFTATVQALQSDAPEWRPPYASRTIDSMEPRGGLITTDQDFSALQNLPLNAILKRAKEIGAKTDNFLIENDPFAGLSNDKPVLAFGALTQAAKRNEFPGWAWQTFLQAKARENDQPKFLSLIAKRISKYPTEAVAEFIFPVSDWLLAISQKFSSQFPEVFDQIAAKLIGILRVQPSCGISGIRRGNHEPNWTIEALNTPVGKIAQALMNDPRSEGERGEVEFPQEWISHVNDLLSLPGDLHRHALVIFAHNLDWFFERDPDWTQVKLLSILDQNDPEDRNALWNGFLWAAKTPSPKLYKKIKFHLLQIAKEQTQGKEGYVGILAGIILAGWGGYEEVSQERYISNIEMRETLLTAGDEFRSSILRNIKNWKSQDGRWEDLLEKLLRDVWPRQMSVRTSKLSTRLFDLAIGSPERFSVRVATILPLLSTIDSGHFWISNLLNSQESIVDVYPEKTLTLLYKVLPENVSHWPFGIDQVLDRIAEVDPTLREDERIIELNRRWNAR